jgi:hypothetical protein
MLIVGAMGMLSPLYALYVADKIAGVDAFVIGVSMSIFLISRSVMQIPIATIIDKIKGEADDYYFLVVSSIFIGIVHLGFLFVGQIWQLFLAKALLNVFIEKQNLLE